MTASIALFFLSPLLKWVTITWALGAGCIAIWFLAPAWLPFNRQNFLIAGAVLLGGGAFYWYAFHAGERHMAQRIAAKDRAAIERVQEQQKEVDACNGGVDWDVTTGTCTR